MVRRYGRGAQNARQSNRPIGSPVERLEDLRFLRGRGEYVDDVPRPGRAARRDPAKPGGARPHPRRCPSAALKRPGVHAVITAATISATYSRHHHAAGADPEFKPYQQPVIAKDKVRYVGEPIAVVVADSAALAEDALEHIALDIEALRRSPSRRPRAGTRACCSRTPAATTSSRCRR